MMTHFSAVLHVTHNDKPIAVSLGTLLSVSTVPAERHRESARRAHERAIARATTMAKGIIAQLGLASARLEVTRQVDDASTLIHSQSLPAE